MERNATIARTPPRLSFYPLLTHSPSPSGMATPPIHVPGAIPFRWEEAPGKPKPENNTSGFGITGRGGSSDSSLLPPRSGPGRQSLKNLKLPPRLQLAMVGTKSSLSLSPPIPSLDGRYAVGVPSRRSCSLTSSVEKSKSCRVGGDRRALWLWRRGKKGRRDVNWECGSPASSSRSVSSSSSSSSNSSGYYYNSAFDASWRGGKEEEKFAEARISRMRRCKSNPLINSQHAPHWLASVCGALRHVIPKRRERKD